MGCKIRIRLRASGPRLAFVWMLFACGAVAAIPSCVTVPAGSAGAREDAIGTITVSTPLFTPIEASVVDGKSLSFGKLRDEQELANAIQQAQVGISDLQYRAIESALKANFSGIQTESVQSERRTLSEEREAYEFEQEKKRSFKSPDVPDPPGGIEEPQSVQDALVQLLKKSGDAFRLPPSEVASLVAAYKTYMVNL